MRSWALRVAGSGLDAMRKLMLLSPWPSAGDVISSQPAVDEADHWHSRAMETATEPLPPSAPKDLEVESKLGWHRVACCEGATTLVVADPPQDANVRTLAQSVSQPETRRCWSTGSKPDAYPSPATCQCAERGG